MKLVGAEVFAQWQTVRRGYERKFLMMVPFNSELPNGDELTQSLQLNLRLFNEQGAIGDLIVEIPREWLR